MSRDYQAALQWPGVGTSDEAGSVHGSSVRLNSYRLQQGEVLPEGYSKNPQGYLIRPSQTIPLEAFDTDFIKQEVNHLHNHVVIVSFIEGAPQLHSRWLHELQDIIAPGKITLHKEVRWGFSYIQLDSATTTKRVLLLTPYKFSVGTALFQSWIPGFDPRKPEGLHIPIWITLRLLPLQFIEYAKEITSYIAQVIEED
jgi:hypothetical protein